MMYKGWFEPFSEPLPRMMIRLEPITPEAGFDTLTPATLPARPVARLATFTRFMSSPFTSVTE